MQFLVATHGRGALPLALLLCCAVGAVSIVVSERLMPSPVFAARAAPTRAVHYLGAKDQSRLPQGDPLPVKRVTLERYRPLAESMRLNVKKPEASRVKPRKQKHYARASW